MIIALSILAGIGIAAVALLSFPDHSANGAKRVRNNTRSLTHAAASYVADKTK